MTTVTIPKELVGKGDLVLVPRREYERLLRAIPPMKKKKNFEAISRIWSEVVPISEKEAAREVGRAIAQVRARRLKA